MRVLVTGSSGHVGGAIAAHLITAGHEVIGLSRRLSQIAGLKQQLLLDIAAPDLVEQISRETAACQVIVHAAADMDKSLYASAISLVNCLGTQQLLNLAAKWETNNFIYLSSVPVIGQPQQLPVTEEHPLNPPTAYHASKVYGEYMVNLAQQRGLAGASFRLTSPIGPGMSDKRIFSVFVRRTLANQPLQLAGQGTRRQDFVDARDVAQAVEQCIVRQVSGLFNIAAGQSISNLELAKKCVEILNSTSPIEFSGQPDPEEAVRWEVSIAKATQQFGYQPRFTIEDSIKAVAAQYANRSD